MRTPEEMKKSTVSGVAAFLLTVGVGVGVVSCKDEASAPAEPETSTEKVVEGLQGV